MMPSTRPRQRLMPRHIGWTEPSHPAATAAGADEAWRESRWVRRSSPRKSAMTVSATSSARLASTWTRRRPSPRRGRRPRRGRATRGRAGAATGGGAAAQPREEGERGQEHGRGRLHAPGGDSGEGRAPPRHAGQPLLLQRRVVEAVQRHHQRLPPAAAAGGRRAGHPCASLSALGSRASRGAGFGAGLPSPGRGGLFVSCKGKRKKREEMLCCYYACQSGGPHGATSSRGNGALQTLRFALFAACACVSRATASDWPVSRCKQILNYFFNSL